MPDETVWRFVLSDESGKDASARSGGARAARSAAEPPAAAPADVGRKAEQRAPTFAEQIAAEQARRAKAEQQRGVREVVEARAAGAPIDTTDAVLATQQARQFLAARRAQQAAHAAAQARHATAVQAGQGAGRALAGGSIGGAASALGGAVPVIGAAVVAIGGLALAAKKVDDTFTQLAEKSQRFSGQVAAAEAFARVQQIRADIETARQLGPGLSRFVRAKSDIDVALQRLGNRVLAPLLERVAPLLEQIATGIEFIADHMPEGSGEMIQRAVTVAISPPAAALLEIARLLDRREAIDNQISLTGWFQDFPYLTPDNFGDLHRARGAPRPNRPPPGNRFEFEAPPGLEL